MWFSFKPTSTCEDEGGLSQEMKIILIELYSTKNPRAPKYPFLYNIEPGANGWG